MLEDRPFLLAHATSFGLHSALHDTKIYSRFYELGRRGEIPLNVLTDISDKLERLLSFPFSNDYSDQPMNDSVDLFKYLPTELPLLFGYSTGLTEYMISSGFGFNGLKTPEQVIVDKSGIEDFIAGYVNDSEVGEIDNQDEPKESGVRSLLGKIKKLAFDLISGGAEEVEDTQTKKNTVYPESTRLGIALRIYHRFDVALDGSCVPYDTATHGQFVMGLAYVDAPELYNSPYFRAGKMITRIKMDERIKEIIAKAKLSEKKDPTYGIAIPSA